PRRIAGPAARTRRGRDEHPRRAQRPGQRAHRRRECAVRRTESAPRRHHRTDREHLVRLASAHRPRAGQPGANGTDAREAQPRDGQPAGEQGEHRRRTRRSGPVHQRTRRIRRQRTVLQRLCVQHSAGTVVEGRGGQPGRTRSPPRGSAGRDPGRTPDDQEGRRMSTDTAATTRRRPPWLMAAIIGAVVVLVLGALAVFVLPDLGKRTIHAEFASTSGLYEGDDVRVLGVSVGRISDIEPRDDLVRVTMQVDSGVEIPSDAKAVVIAQSLVSARFVQLTPVYSGGPTIEDGTTIPMQRTASPVEWDQIKTELMRLSEALGPEELDPQGSLGRFIDTAADNLEGNGQTVRAALRELSDTMRTLSEGRTDLFSTIRNLQTFVSVLSSSNEQIVQFGGRL